jgi:hypothetical protein
MGSRSGKLSYEKLMKWGEALAGSKDRSYSLPQEPARLLGIETGSLVCREWKRQSSLGRTAKSLRRLLQRFASVPMNT